MKKSDRDGSPAKRVCKVNKGTAVKCIEGTKVDAPQWYINGLVAHLEAQYSAHLPRV